MSKLIDLTGKRYGNLVVMERLENESGGITKWKCLCDCGNYTIVRGRNLKSGAVKSCGCLRKTKKPTLRHNMSKTRLYREWASIKRRCYTVTDNNYKNYGKRGIGMCDEWKNSFESFMEWALQNGYSDDLTIERINVNGDYCPENCLFIPHNQQASNRRSSYSITYENKTQNLTEWCKELNLPYMLIHNRIYKLGWTFEKAISEPVHVEKCNKKGNNGGISC